MKDTHYYRHTPLGRFKVWIYQQIALACIIGFTVLACAGLSNAFSEGELRNGMIILALFFLTGGWLNGLALFNLYPDIYTDEDGISISFMLSRVKIPWNQVLEVGIGGILVRRTYVSAQRITPLHYLYSFGYVHVHHPCFIIAPALEHRDELIAEIKRHVSQQSMSQ
jgi:hypothetical protein